MVSAELPLGLDAVGQTFAKRPSISTELTPVKNDRIGSLGKLGRAHYLQLMMPLHVELLKLQNFVKQNGFKIVVLFEGRDSSDRSRTIKEIMQHVNPRGCRVVALGSPTEEERQQWYLQRYVQQLPTEGEIVLFDRSWYKRAVDERVLGESPASEFREFLRSTPEFELMLVRSGIILIKYYFSMGKSEARKRLRRQRKDRLEQLKLAQARSEHPKNWQRYESAVDDLFYYTSSPESPWMVVNADERRRARINTIRHFLSCIGLPERLSVHSQTGSSDRSRTR